MKCKLGQPVEQTARSYGQPLAGCYWANITEVGHLLPGHKAFRATARTVPGKVGQLVGHPWYNTQTGPTRAFLYSLPNQLLPPNQSLAKSLHSQCLNLREFPLENLHDTMIYLNVLPLGTHDVVLLCPALLEIPASAPPGSLLEMQNPSPHPKSAHLTRSPQRLAPTLEAQSSLFLQLI